MVNRPSNIPADLDQLRPAIVRSLGSTPSERYLARLGDRTFLNLWSYPNPYREQKQGGVGDGKELCDLLVVCDPYVIVFSEKQIAWPNKELSIAWPRWFKKAVLDAANQLKGAERWLTQFPDRIFLDKDCKEPFPLKLPPAESRRVHRIVVARGAAEACHEHFEGGLGTFVIKPDLTGADHWTTSTSSHHPFAIGDIDPDGNFVHVFDEVALDIVMRELDTISDFTDYLEKRAAFLRSKRIVWCHGEEELLSYYAVHINENGDHDFTPPDGNDWSTLDALAIGPGGYETYMSHDQYIAKREADEISYTWDRLIRIFTDHMMGGTSVVLPGYTYSLTESEMAVRYMALQSRFARRGLSEAVVDALRIGKNADKFFRLILSSQDSKGSETAFFILTLKYHDFMDASGGYEQYRLYRVFFLQIYAKAVLMKYPYLERIIGIAMEPPSQGRGASEDIMYGAQSEWTDAERSQIQKDCEDLKIMGALKTTPYQGTEFPDVPASQDDRPIGNRQQRRAQAARARKKGPSVKR
jgi:hypothetical protein